MNERKEYIDKMAEQLRSWDNEITKYQQKAAQMNENVKQKYQDEVTKLKARKKQVQQKLDELKSSSDSAWKELKNGFDRSWKELKTAFNNANSSFKKQEKFPALSA